MSYKALQRSCAASIPFYLLGFSLLLVVFGLPYWVTYDPEDDTTGTGPQISYRHGIFFICAEDELGCHILADTTRTTAWWKAVQALFTIAAISGVISGTTYPRLPVSGFFQIFAGLNILTATIISTVLGELLPGQSVGWCLPVAIVAGALLIIGGLILVIARGCNGCSDDKVFFWVSRKK